MNLQEILSILDNSDRADILTLQGIEQFNNGNLEEALLAFEESSEINPKSIPNLLYHSLCCFSLIRSRTMSNLEGIVHPESQRHIQNMISNLETATDLMKFINWQLQRF